MASKLSIDILSITFEGMEQENDGTLYSCILVNREWCQIAMPFLWKNPWKKILKNNIKINTVNQYKILFNCFLMMMSKESKDFFKINEIKFFAEHDPSLHTPLFNYASFCKVIDSFKIHNMVYYNIIGKVLGQIYLVIQEILKLLISNTSKLKCFIMYYKSYPITSFPNSSISLSQLNELHCNTTIDETILYGLSQLCRNIERLVIEVYNGINSGIIQFIEQQINLKRVKIWGDSDFEFSAQGQCKNLGEVLVAKSSSIIDLDLERYLIMIPPTLLKNFQNNLTIFKFTIDRLFTEERLIKEFENVLKEISLQNLQQLIIYDDCPSFDIIAKMIEKTNGELLKISVGNFYLDEEDEDADMLVSVIAKCCPKLELLAVWINNLDKIIELIKECKKLRGLVLQAIYYTNNLDVLFKVLCNDASDQLRKLQFAERWDISKEALTEFFECWKQNERIPLNLYINSYIFKDEYEDIIKEYQELGVIRKFEKCFVPNLLDDWE